MDLLLAAYNQILASATAPEAARTWQVAKETATLFAALIAAVAAIVSASMSRSTSRLVARETANAALKREAIASRRQSISNMKSVLFDNAVLLRALTSCCGSVGWLATTPIEKLHSDGEMFLSRISFAIRVLEHHGLAIEDSIVSKLDDAFPGLCDAAFRYKSQIDLGNIEPSGSANDKAKAVQSLMTSQLGEWKKRMRDLQVVVANVCTEAEPIQLDPS